MTLIFLEIYLHNLYDCNSLQNYLNKLELWTTTNKLYFNIIKYKVVSFSRKLFLNFFFIFVPVL